MNRYEIDINKKYGMLTPIKVSRRTKKNVYWICRCDCNNETEIRQGDLATMRIVSCGCMRGKNELEFENARPRLYRIYGHMIDRCYNPKCSKYKWYGRKGIDVCEEWLDSFEVFFDYCMNNGYKNGLSIDRIDNSKGYNPNNVKFSTMKEQNNNKTTNVNLTINGITKTLAQWLEFYNMSNGTFRKRIKKGMSYEEALTTPIDVRYSHKKARG